MVLRLVEHPEKLDPILLVCCVIALYEDPTESVQALRHNGSSGLREILEKLQFPAGRGPDNQGFESFPILLLVATALDYFGSRARNDDWYGARVAEYKKELAKSDLQPSTRGIYHRNLLYLLSIKELASFRETANAALLTAQVVTDPRHRLEAEDKRSEERSTAKNIDGA
jgi:hypothetical protein